MKKILITFLFVASLEAADTCWVSGTGPTYWKVCVSDQAQVTIFESPKGVSHIAQGNGAIETYVIANEISECSKCGDSFEWESLNRCPGIKGLGEPAYISW